MSQGFYMTRRIFRTLTAVPLILALASAARADALTDALAAAQDAYSKGDLALTSQSLNAARQALDLQQNALLAARMPAAPAGWTMTPSDAFAAGIASMGNGVGVAMDYENADKSMAFQISYIADNAMLIQMASMFSDPATMAMMGNVVKVGDQTLLETDGTLSTVAGNRVMVQIAGAPVAVMLPVVQSIDYASLGTFDAK